MSSIEDATYCDGCGVMLSVREEGAWREVGAQYDADCLVCWRELMVFAMREAGVTQRDVTVDDARAWVDASGHILEALETIRSALRARSPLCEVLRPLRPLVGKAALARFDELLAEADAAADEAFEDVDRGTCAGQSALGGSQNGSSTHPMQGMLGDGTGSDDGILRVDRQHGPRRIIGGRG